MAFHIGEAKYKAGGPELKLLYRLCFGKVGKQNVVKKHLRLFTGFADDKGKTKAESVANGVKLSEVKLMLGLCDQDTGGKKDEMVERLVDFLAKPSASGKASIAEKEAEKKRKRDAKKERAAKKKERNKVKREKAKKKKEKDKAKREKAKAKKAAEAADSSDDEDSDADSGSDSEEEEEDEAPPKKKKKKAPKEEEEEEESSDSDDELQIAALTRPKITDSILLEKIQALATKSDFETLSLKGIRKKLSEELKQDVTPYKKKIKQLVIETMQANAAAAPTEAS